MQNIKSILNELAFALGFSAFGVARAAQLDEYASLFDNWIEMGYQGNMDYMLRNREKRLDPRQLLPGAKSVIVLALNYFPQSHDASLPKPAGEDLKTMKISKYAYGVDYHDVIRKKLKILTGEITRQAPESQNRGFTDSAPVLERAWAVKAGLGWTGKNACLIMPGKGSFFFLAGIITTMELEADTPFRKNHCGNCVRCLEACPTGAITAPGQVDARRCISYQTIENKEPVPQEIMEKNPGWIFGCDICQDVCPHNRFAVPHHEPEFNPLHGIDCWADQQWRSLDEPGFRRLFKEGHSPMGRISFKKLTDNINL